MKKLFLFFVSAIFALTLACNSGDDDVAVTGVSLSKSELTLSVNGTEQLTATVLPANATNKGVAWLSNNTAVATVSAAGLVKAVAPGPASITVTTNDGGFKAACALTVLEASVAVTGVTLDIETLTLETGGLPATLEATIAPENAANKNVAWLSNAPGIANVSPTGVVTAAGNGTATITATTEDGGFEAACAVTVITRVTGVSLSQDTLTLPLIGAPVALTATVIPETATNKNVEWTSDTTSIATVDANGLVAAVTQGTAIITATTEDGGKTAACAATVLPPPKPVVYVAGRNRLTAATFGTNQTPVYWKDGVCISLLNDVQYTGSAAYGNAYSIFVDGADNVYVAGATDGRDGGASGGYDNSWRPILWTNDSEHQTYLEAPTATAQYIVPKSVFARNNKIYVAGGYYNTTPATATAYARTARLWTVEGSNITAKTLDGQALGSNGFPRADARSVFVTDDRLYIAGTYSATDEYDTSFALWDGTARETIPNGVMGRAVFVSGSTVYLGGQALDGYVAKPTVWKGETPTHYDLALGGSDGIVTSIYVDGETVYAAGYYYGGDMGNSGYQGVVWKNGVVLYPIGNGNTSTTYTQPESIFVYDGVVYVAGIERNGGTSANPTTYATLWTDGVPTRLSEEATSQANAVFVKASSSPPAVFAPVSGIEVKPPTATINPGATAQLMANVLPANALNKKYTWRSSNTNVATVNPTTGLVTAIAAGEANIIATTEDGGKTLFCAVSVVSNIRVKAP